MRHGKVVLLSIHYVKLTSINNIPSSIKGAEITCLVSNYYSKLGRVNKANDIYKGETPFSWFFLADYVVTAFKFLVVDSRELLF